MFLQIFNHRPHPVVPRVPAQIHQVLQHLFRRHGTRLADRNVRYRNEIGSQFSETWQLFLREFRKFERSECPEHGRFPEFCTPMQYF